MKTRFTVEVLALAGLAAGLVVTSGCKTTYSDSADLSLTPMPKSLSPEPTGDVTYPTPESEKPQPYYISHPEAVAALDKVPAKTPAAPVAASGYSTYVVKQGESLSKIAANHGFRTIDVLALNPGINPDKIKVGQTIYLPAAGTVKPVPKTQPHAKTAAGGNTYVVQKGDILGRIANKFKVKLADLKMANGLTSDKIVVGQKLVIPGAKAEPKSSISEKLKPAKVVVAEPKVTPQPKHQSNEAKAPTPSAVKVKTVEPPVIEPPTPAIVTPPPVIPDTPATPPSVSVPQKGTPYVVQEGQDLFDISVKWGVSAADVKAFNHLDSDKVVPGQTIMIPPPKAE